MVIEALERQFGPEWQRAPGIGEDAVAAFEAANGITLPEPYRAFVAETANGAVGPPYYGLVPLGAPAGANSYEIGPGSLARPFPLTEFWLWEDEDNPDEERLAAVGRDGALPLGTDGCGHDYVLVCTGAVRGQVWVVTDVGAGPVAADFERWIVGDVFPDAAYTLAAREVAPATPPPAPGLRSRLRGILSR